MSARGAYCSAESHTILRGDGASLPLHHHRRRRRHHHHLLLSVVVVVAVVFRTNILKAVTIPQNVPFYCKFITFS